MTERPGSSLGRRIFVGTALILVAVVAAAVAVISVLGERIATREAADRIAASASLRVASQQQHFQQLGLLAEIMAGKPEFKAYLIDALAAGDRLSILDQLEERSLELGYDLALVVDAEGKLAARTDQPDAPAADLSARPLVRRVRSEFEAAGMWPERGRLYEAVAVPMAVNDGVFGFLALGYEITDVRALEVKRSTGSETLFLSGAEGAVVASSLTPPETERVVAALRAEGSLLGGVLGGGGTAAQRELRLGGERWLAQVAPLADADKGTVGAVVSLVSLDRALAGYRQVRDVLLAVGAGALLAALALSYLLARRVSRPIGELVRATAAAREGRYDVAIPPGRSGEVRNLAESFNALLAELRERRDMAEYVEKLARNLPEAAAPAGPAAPVEPPASRDVALLGIELRELARPRTGERAGPAVERLTRQLRTLAAAIGAQGGRIEAIHGHRVVAGFSGPSRGGRALAAASDALRMVGAPEHAFDDVEAPATAIVTGTIAAGTVSWGEAGSRTLLGLPLAQLEALLREAGPGEIALAPEAHAELADAFASAGLELAPQRGLLSTRSFYLMSGADSARLEEVTGRMLTHLSTGPEAEAYATLSGVGPGSLLGSRFEILSVLGSGGMGVVYKARDRELDDLVALKMLKSDVASDSDLVARLKTELKLARRITHPNVLRTFDFGEIDGRPFISMEYVRGITLRDMLEQSGRLPFSAAVWLARQLLAGLAAAHGLEILHRDIKPENVLLDSAGNLKLMDFGLARPVERLEPGHTREGWLIGTPNYLAPEQIRGQEADRRSDVYACGVVLYELFTGGLPFAGASPADMLTQHLHDAPRPPRELWPEIPRALETLLLSCLAKAADERPRDAAELLSRLERAVG